MVTCNRCGAELPLDAWECPYCRTLTVYGHQRREAEAAAARAHADAVLARDHAFALSQREEAQRSLARSSQHAMLWSLGSLVLCCSPLALVGLVLGFRSRALARRTGLVIPTTATLGIVIGFLQLALFGAALAFGLYADMQVKERVEQLNRELGQKPEQLVLTQGTACALAERHLLTEGFGKVSAISIEDFRCDGALEQASGGGAELKTLEFKAGSDKVRASACFSRGARWSVDSIQERGCSETKTPAASAAAAAPSPSSR